MTYDYHKDWMSEDQKECHQMLADLLGGFHHITGPVKEFGYGIQTNVFGELATFDFDGLTRLVLLAHERCIRASVMTSGPGMIKIALHKRKRDGGMSERHPTIQDVLAKMGATQ